MLTKEKIYEILYKWNFWGSLKERLLKRAITKKILEFSAGNEVIITRGVRRSGKSRILFLIMQELMKRVSKEQILYVNFDEQAFTEDLSLRFLDNIYEVYKEKINPEKFPYVFLDEIQHIEKWERWVRTKQELKEAKIFVTGSSSKLLSKEFGTALTGRSISFEIFPLSFKEFLLFKRIEKIDEISEKSRIKSLLMEFLHYGAFPAVVLEENKEKKEVMLKGYFDDMIYKDVVSRHEIRDVNSIKMLALYLVTNIGKRHTYNSIKKAIGKPLDVVKNYCSYLNEAYLLFFLPIFSYKLKEQMIYPRKVYCIDSGLRNAVSFRFMEDIGIIYENTVFIELVRRGKEPYYWRDEQGGEVDFVVKEGMKIKEIIQVCYDIEDEKTKKREIKALLNAIQEFKIEQGVIITENFEEEEKIDGKTIKYIPLWKWLLE